MFSHQSLPGGGLHAPMPSLGHTTADCRATAVVCTCLAFTILQGTLCLLGLKLNLVQAEVGQSLIVQRYVAVLLVWTAGFYDASQF
jgi:hypothetical protein